MSEYWEAQLREAEAGQSGYAPTSEDENISSDTLSLLQLGYLTEKIGIFGNTIILKTLKVGEELAASQAANKFKDLPDFDANRAFMTALVAASIETVNGIPLIYSLGPEDPSLVERKFSYVTNNYYWPVIQEIYREYIKLVERADDALEEFRKKSSAGR